MSPSATKRTGSALATPRPSTRNPISAATDFNGRIVRTDPPFSSEREGILEQANPLVAKRHSVFPALTRTGCSHHCVADQPTFLPISMTSMSNPNPPRHPAEWLKITPEGLFCAPGGFHIDPVRPVERAVVTHGHSDHARAGHGAVLATPETVAIMQARYGGAQSTRFQPLRYGEPVRVGDVTLALAPAGHVLGSAQVILEHAGARVVVSGDYKRRPDLTCSPFEPVSCDVFVTEATFGLPVFRHPNDSQE